MERFSEGDYVEWTSQSQGYSKTKVGKVVAVLPAGYHPNRLEAFWAAGWKKPVLPGLQRDHESYMVNVKGRSVYWPRVSKLKRAMRPSEGESQS